MWLACEEDSGVRHSVVALTVVALFSGAVACGGGTFFISASDDGVSFFAVSGMVSVVHLTIINGGQVTVVTLIDTGRTQTMSFCGNVVAQFPSNTFVKAIYKHGSGCDIVLQV